MFIKGFGVLTVPLAATTNTPQLWRSMVFKCGILFSAVRLASSHGQIFRIEKDGCTQGNKVASLLFNDTTEARHSASLHRRYGFFSQYCCVYDPHCGTKHFL